MIKAGIRLLSGIIALPIISGYSHTEAIEMTLTQRERERESRRVREEDGEHTVEEVISPVGDDGKHT